MAMVKTVSPSGWDFDGPIASLIKVAGGGLRGFDRTQFIKRAGAASNIFLPILDSVKFAKDEEPVHLIALGAYEAYGANRNGDAFEEQVCKDCHDTFTKFAKFYRNHKNKDPRLSYGIIKASAYNQVMRRVELLVGLNKTKEAAERNNGIVADKELQKLASGKDLAVSMACRVPYDICSYCGNKARTRDEYCKAASCKVGGCADNLTKLVKIANDVHRVHVKNRFATWFDISDVYRPADPICYAGGADYLQKAAADSGFFGIDGAKTAADLGIMAPLAVVLFQDTMHAGEWTPYLAEQIKLAHGLHAMEQNDAHKFANDVRRAFTPDMQPHLNLDALELTIENPVKVAACLGALADQKIILSLHDFSRLTKRAELADDAAPALTGVYGRMIADGSLETRLANNRYAPAEKLASGKQRQKAAQMHSTYALTKEAVDHRVKLSALRGHQAPAAKTTFWNEKKAHDSPLAEELARDYAIYKVASLRRIAQFDDSFLLTARLAMCQNSVV